MVDACHSGALLRTKGGAHVPGEEAAEAPLHGVAYLTSSAPDEVAQEADALQGSFFTHALTAGLRGAADRSGDGAVTLSEAYDYAYARTLASTEGTLGGPQHPSFDVALLGHGDAVLTRVAAEEARLRVPPELVGLGPIVIADPDRRVVAEVGASPERTLSVALPPGPYVLHADARSPRVLGLTLGARDDVLLEEAAFEPAPRPRVRDKGGRRGVIGGLLVATSAVSLSLAGYSFGRYVGSLPTAERDPLAVDPREAHTLEQRPLHRFMFFGLLGALSTVTAVIHFGGGR